MGRLATVVACGVFVSGLLRTAADAEAQIVITQAKAMAGKITPGDLAGFPITISRSGHYRLDGNLTVPADTTAFAITQRNVTLDLGGFAIIGPNTGPGSGQGISAPYNTGSVAAMVLRNGTIMGMGSDGVFVTGSGHRIERIVSVSNGGSGIKVGEGSVVVSSRALDNRNVGIEAGAGSLIQGNVTAGNIWGIAIASGSTLVNNVATDNVAHGFLLTGSGWGANVASGNNGGNNQPQRVGGVPFRQNLCGGALCQ